MELKDFFKEDIRKEITIWIEALRSGEYIQGFQTLQPSRTSYCCLGVACKILIPEEVLNYEKILNPEDGVEYFQMIGAVPLGNQPGSPNWLEEINYTTGSVLGYSIVALNDGHHFSFGEIADVMEILYLKEDPRAAKNLISNILEREGHGT